MIRPSRSRELVATTLAASSLIVLALGLAGCGKYGRPMRAKPEAAAGAAPGATAPATPDESSTPPPAEPPYKDPTDPRVEGNRP